MKRLFVGLVVVVSAMGCGDGSNESNGDSGVQGLECTADTTDEIRCNEHTLERCDGSDWVVLQDCGAKGGTCNDDNRPMCRAK